MALSDIDEHQLEKEWLKQVQLVDDVVEDLQESLNRLRILKSKFKLTEAQIGKEVRRSPKRFGIARVSEKSIADAVLMDERYQKIQGRILKEEYRSGLLRGHLDVLEDRKKALENLVILQGRNYYSEPKVPERERERVKHANREQIRTKGKRTMT